MEIRSLDSSQIRMGNIYYLDKDGVMMTGWHMIGGKWYYF